MTAHRPIRIFWQSFVDETASAPYLKQLKAYLANAAAPDTSVDVRSVSPPDRDFGRLSELRCAVRAIDASFDAEDEGYDAYVMGHFQDPGLYEIRSSLRIPVIGTGEATLLAASQLGRRLGLVTLDSAFQVWHMEQAERHGLSHRLVRVASLDSTPAGFSAAFDGNADAKAELLASFIDCANIVLDAGADVIVPAGVLLGLLVSGEHGLTVGHAPVINCATVALKAAEMWVQLHRLNGTEPSRGPSFALTNARARGDFRAMLHR